MPNILKSVDRLFVAGMMRNEEGEPANVQVVHYLSGKGFQTKIDEGWGNVDGHVFGWRPK